MHFVKPISCWCFLSGPFFLAALVTCLNACKPVVVDDTAYLAFARHIADDPLDPYGFDLFWYREPEPAMTILAPPVLPYWLALGVRLFGDDIIFLKLWLFPILGFLAWALEGLLRRFARGTERVMLPLIMLSPIVLPTVNLMLDIPALALGLASLRFLMSACDRQSAKLAIVAGVLAALAMQTKYTMLLVPPVLLWYAVTQRRIRFGVGCVLVAMLGFALWEFVIAQQHGQSHFLYHIQDQQQDWSGKLKAKLELTAPLVGHLGLLAFGSSLFACRALGVPRRVIIAFAFLWLLGVSLVATLPYHDSVLIRNARTGREKLTVHATAWRTAGTFTLVVATGCACVLLVRRKPRLSLRWNWDSLFVVGWVVLEVLGYYVLTPFPAGRRVLGVGIALTMLAARTMSRVVRARPDRRPPSWMLPLCIGIGLGFATLDTFEASVEKSLALQAARAVKERDAGSTVWFAGHWGFQHYCERAGMNPAIEGITIVEPGDYLVWPLAPDAKGFYRPDTVHLPAAPPADVADLLVLFEWDDWLSAQSIPNFYGGTEPITGRDHPRLVVGVYRVTRPWRVGESHAPGKQPGLDLLRGRFPNEE